ncbi:MAG: CPBP family intramembrane metalloprotease [Firmicutes bacterium]|nr:CPBP family intramembrane metalloprotease [Bacillota bacterium]
MRQTEAGGPDPLAPAWQIWHPFAVLLASFVLALLPMALTARPYNVVGLNLTSYWLQFVGFFLGPLYIACVRYKQKPAVLGIRKVKARLYFAAPLCGLAFYLLNVLVALAVTLVCGRDMALQNVLQVFDYAQNPFEIWGLILSVAVLAPVSEEMLFRAFLYPPLKAAVGKSKAVLIASFLFGVSHGSLWTLFPMWAGGVCFTLLYDRYRSLAMNIIAHATWNTIALSLFFYSYSL